MKRAFKSLLFTILLLATMSTYADAGQLTMKVLNVDDGECILLQCNDELMVIDTGYAKSWDHIQTELEALNVSDITYLVLTHPHQDHIGSATRLLDAYPVECAILPPIEHDTAVYERVMDSLEDYGVEPWYPYVGDSFTLGNAAQITVYAPHPVAYN